MNAVEIEEAVSKLIEEPFQATEFPYAFLEAFGNKPATLQRLRSVGKNSTNKTDVVGNDVVSVMQRNNIHLATIVEGGPDSVAALLKRLVESPATAKHKAKFALATDGHTVHAECLNSEEPPLVCTYQELADHFGYFLELAGISTVRQIRENAFDIKATGRLNRLYVELLRTNPTWDGDERREELNHFFARLIFCFFAEDTGILHGNGLFTDTLRQMTDPSGDNTNFVLAEIFRAMDIPMKDREAAKLRSWAGQFPYVNGGLFGGGTTENDVPKFTQIARSYLLHIGSLDWTQINPDIFGSMIQAVADDEERGALGMHYTSVPNILKVLNPLFLDDLHAQLKEAGDNPRKLLNLRKRLSRIRVFDPACGSGNFLVIAYKEMRKIEAEINILRGEADRASEIPLTNFRGIELRHFAVEVARLALIIAEYQCDELYRGKRLALAEFLPLNKENWITHGNALRLDWLKVCPPTGTGVKLVEDDLFQTPLDQIEIDFENEGGETYICGNPPYSGKGKQESEQKNDLKAVFEGRVAKWGYIDLVGAWFLKAADYCSITKASSALVATNSVVMGRQAPDLWTIVLKQGVEIFFAHRSFPWSNNAARNAAVFCVIVGLKMPPCVRRMIYDGEEAIAVGEISHYLTPGKAPLVVPNPRPISTGLPEMVLGNMPNDGGALSMTFSEFSRLCQSENAAKQFTRRFYGSKEFNNDIPRYCLWIEDELLPEASGIAEIARRIDWSRNTRLASPDKSNRRLAERPHQMREFNEALNRSFIVPRMTSERREFLPCGVLPKNAIVSSQAFAIFDAPIWALAILVSRIHLVWVGTIAGKFKEDYRYSSDLAWHTFPVIPLTEEDKANLTRCAENILLAREAHWPATIADLYDPEAMPEDLRAAHDRNDETLERIYIGRRFKNDTERLETLFKMYSEMTGKKN